MYGFLFDVDGTLTKPTEDPDTIGKLDVDLLHRIVKISEKWPVAFITGRSIYYYDEVIRNIGVDGIEQINAYLEFGLLHYVNSKLSKTFDDSEFEKERDRFHEEFYTAVQHQGYTMDKEFHVDYPSHGGIWFEKKVVMSSVIRGRVDSPEIARSIATELMQKNRYNFRLLNHPIGIDVIPSGWSKKNAAELFSRGKSCYWYVYGDNNSDAEMLHGVQEGEFIDVRIGASKEVEKHLDSLEVLN